MSTEWDAVAAGVHAAQRMKNAVRSWTGEMASLIAGGLRAGRVDPEVLRDLKRELRDFDMVTGKWKR
jgi:hypothetical protein